jgi:hypothetical protein
VGYNGRGWGVGERMPFLRAAAGPGGEPVPDYTHQRRRRHIGGRGDGGEEDEDPVRGLKREEDMIFGKWPWRAFNRHVSRSFLPQLQLIYIIEPDVIFSGGGTNANLYYVVVAMILTSDYRLGRDTRMFLHQGFIFCIHLACFVYLPPQDIFIALVCIEQGPGIS